MREPPEPVDQQVAVLGGAWGTMVQSKQFSAADYRRDGHHRDTGIAEHNGYAKTLIASASRKKP